MIARALQWSVLAAVLGAVIQFAVMAVLSRLLGPVEFGIIAASALAMRFVSYFAQLGLGPALVQREQIDARHHSAALILALCLGIVSWLLFILLALPLSVFFREPEVAKVLLVAPAGLMLASLAGVPQALLRRQMRFRAIAYIELSASVLGNATVGIVLAILGFGVWSLVFGSIAQQVVLVVGYSTASWLRPLARPTQQHFRDLFGYGSRYSLVGFLDFLSSNVETLFTGRVLGVGTLGVFNRAQSVTSMPVDLIMSAVSRVMFPAYSRLGSERAQLGAAVKLSIHLSTLLTLPVACVMSITAPDLVLGVLGATWAPAVPVAQALAWSIPASYMSVFLGNALDVIAAFRVKAATIAAVTALKIGLMFVFGMRFGLVGVAFALVVGEWVRAISMALQLARLIRHVPAFFLPGLLRDGAAVASGIAIALLAYRATLEPSLNLGQHHIVGLAVQVAIAGVVFVLIARNCVKRMLMHYRGGPLDLGYLKRLARL